MTSDLDPILQQITANERIDALAITLRDGSGARLHVAPALGAARTAIVAALARQIARPILYVVVSSEAARRADGRGAGRVQSPRWNRRYLPTRRRAAAADRVLRRRGR